MTIGVFARSTSRQARALVDALESEAPGRVRLFDLDLPAESMASLSQDGPVWDGVQLSSLEAAWVHGFHWEDPVLPRGDGERDWSLWQPGFVLDQQKHSFLFSMLSRMAAAGVATYNSPHVHLAAFSKLSQLREVAAGKCRLPNLLLANDAAAVDRFLTGRGDVVWRTATGRCAWQLFRGKQRDALIGPTHAPVLLAEVVPGSLVRVYVFDGQPLLTLHSMPPNAEGLERMELFWSVSAGAAAHTTAEALHAAGVRWGQATYVDTGGLPVLYDVDADPILDDLPRDIARALTASLARSLLGRPASLHLSRGAHERESLFLRRMNRFLFEIEATKYPS